MLYGLVFISRYLDLFWTESAWNLIWKIVYITTSFYVVIIMLKVYPRTRERERAWKFGIYAVAGSLLFAPLLTWILERPWPSDWFMEVYCPCTRCYDDTTNPRL